MEKIRITSEEVAGATVPPVQQPRPTGGASSPPLISPGAGRTPRNPALIIGAVMGGVGIIAVVVVLLLGTLFRGPSLESWKQQEIRRLNSEIASSPKTKAFIESIHPLVTYTGANVKAFGVTTLDGSDRLGKNASNISTEEFVITYHWDGPVQKDGYTDVLYVWDKQSGQLRSSRYLATSAVVNLDDIDWVSVGTALAPLFKD